MIANQGLCVEYFHDHMRYRSVLAAKLSGTRKVLEVDCPYGADTPRGHGVHVAEVLEGFHKRHGETLRWILKDLSDLPPGQIPVTITLKQLVETTDYLKNS